ncbi:MAG TPA: hypothetical protein PLD91_00195 [Spirochaetota bacterium]|nr:hypothetical protein [Spirochaetota bacterium]
MNKKAAIACATLILLLFSAGIRLSAASIESHEDAVIASCVRGDYKALAGSLESMITEHPMDPVSVIHYGTLFSMAEVLGPGPAEKTAVAVREKLGVTRGDDAALCLLKLRVVLEKVLYRARGAPGARVTEELKPVRKWTLYGPYHRYGAADIDYQFQPELMASGRGIFPQKRILVTESDGWLDPANYLFPDRGIAYASVSFKTLKPVKIRLYSGGSYKVFINGREAVRNLDRERRNMRVFRVRNGREITVTVKMIGSPFERLRMLVTDEHNAIIEPEIVQGGTFMNECDVTEELDYPYDALVRGAASDPERGNRHLGMFFDELDSGDAVRYYKKSAAKKKNAFTLFLLARSLMERNRGDLDSAGYGRGLAIINELKDQRRSFIPAWQEKVEHYIREGNYAKAFDEGKVLAAAAPGNPHGLAAYLKCLNALNYEKEFEETAARARKEFPDFIPVYTTETEYYRKRDRNKFMASLVELIQRDCSAPGVRSLVRMHLSRGDYRSALDLIQKYNFNENFSTELVETLIKKGDLKAARSVILKRLVNNESPVLYYSLALIDMLQSEDPSMYLQKTLLLQPSLFSVSDYANYLENNVLENPFSRFGVRREPIGTSPIQKDFGGHPSTVLFRGRIFLLQKDGSSRVFCEDIVHVGTDDGVLKWSNYRIPYPGQIRPIHLSVYDEKGTRADSYPSGNLQTGRCLNINSIAKNSIIHLSYIVDNPIMTPPESRFFSLPLEYLQHYDEPVRRVSIQVIAPQGVAVNFLFKDRVAVRKTISEGFQVHEASIDNIPAVKKEPFSGGRQNSLQYYSFSTMDGFSDFSVWYRGIMMRKMSSASVPASRFKKDTLEKTIAAVYDFVAREIRPRRNVLYLPDSPENTLFRKSGTPEDKTLLAQALLQRLGVSSYVAFARNRFLPGSEVCLYPGYFTHVLLCVPLDARDALWLDFSGRYFRCGVTACAVNGADALVMLLDSYTRGRVRSLDNRSTVRRYDIDVRDDGSALCDIEASFIGTQGDMRKYFSSPLERGESVRRFFRGSVPGFSMETFRVENYKECDRPFIVAAKGSGSGIALSEPGRMILQPVLNKCEVYGYAALPERARPLVIEKPIDEKETYRYTLPLHYGKQEMARTLALNTRFGSCRLVIAKKGGSPVLEVKKEVHVNAALIERGDYNEFVNFCLELKKIENETVILKQ